MRKVLRIIAVSAKIVSIVAVLILAYTYLERFIELTKEVRGKIKEKRAAE